MPNKYFVKKLNLLENDKLFLIFPHEIDLIKLIIEIKDINLSNNSNNSNNLDNISLNQLRNSKSQNDVKENNNCYLFDPTNTSKLYLIRNTKDLDWLVQTKILLESTSNKDIILYYRINHEKYPREYYSINLINKINECNLIYINQIREILLEMQIATNLEAFKKYNNDLFLKLKNIQNELFVALNKTSISPCFGSYDGCFQQKETNHDSYFQYISRIYEFAAKIQIENINIERRIEYSFQLTYFAELLLNLYRLVEKTNILISSISSTKEKNIKEITKEFNTYMYVLSIEELLSKIQHIERYIN